MATQMGNLAELGQRLRAAREQANVTQEALAVRAGVGAATIRRIEAGRHEVRLSTLDAIARALEVDVYELLGRAS